MKTLMTLAILSFSMTASALPNAPNLGCSAYHVYTNAEGRRVSESPRPQVRYSPASNASTMNEIKSYDFYSEEPYASLSVGLYTRTISVTYMSSTSTSRMTFPKGTMNISVGDSAVDGQTWIVSCYENNTNAVE